jgi:hypothetical protein
MYHLPDMELASDTKILAAYSPTSTPLLDVLRPVSREARGKLSAGEYFFLSGAFMLWLVTMGVPALRGLVLPSSVYNIAFTMGLLPVLAFAAAAMIHELGHFLTAWPAGFRLLRLAAAPGNHGAQALHPSRNEVLPVGCMILVPRRPGLTQDLERRLFSVLLGGPLLSIVWPVILEICPYWPKTQPWTQWFVHLWAAASALIGIAALLPDTSRRGIYSDGARLLMLLKKDALAARWIAIIRMQLALSDGQHPRAWLPEWISQTTSQSEHDTRDAVTGYWLAYFWAAERGDITSATRYLEEALAAPPAVAAGLRDRLFLEAAVFQAWFRENSGKAQSWVEQIRLRKLGMAEEERLKIALLWAEGSLFDAWEKLSGHLSLLQHMPASGVRDLAEKSAFEWKRQMESRMLTRAWRTMYTVTQQVEGATAVTLSG